MAITASEAQRHLVDLIERVNLDQIEIESVGEHGSAMLISKDEYDSLLETSYLLKSPSNASLLVVAINNARNGGWGSEATSRSSKPVPQYIGNVESTSTPDSENLRYRQSVGSQALAVWQGKTQESARQP